MSINANLNRMLLTTAIRIVQIIAAIWLVIDLPWPLIVGVAMTHAYEVTLVLIPGLGVWLERVLPTKDERDSAGRD